MVNRQFFSIPEMIAVHARCRPNSVAWQTAQQKVTWRSFDEMVNASANALIAAGVKKGQPVALLIDSSLWSWTQVFGVLRSGAVLTPLNTMLPPTGIAALLADSRASHLIVSNAWAALAVETVGKAASSGIEPIVLSQDGSMGGSLDLTAQSAAARLTAPEVCLQPQDPASIIYSSGTTGQPKGIIHTHSSRTDAAAILAAGFRCSASTRTLLTTPPHTNGSFMIILPTIAVGGTIYVSSGFKPDRYLDEIRDFRPTLAFMVPTMAQALVDLPMAAQTDWSCFDFIVAAGAPMPAELKRRTREMTGNRLGELWGFTEGVATIIQPHEMAEHPASVGRPTIGCEVRVIDSGGREMAAGEVGELVGRCAMNMAGYHRRPDANRDICWQAPDGREFLRTGDLGVIDVDGWVSIKGRMKDMLISGGLNIYPSDIEAALLEHHAVLDCSVVGVPHKKWGETPVAFVMLKHEHAIEAEVLKGWVNDRVGRHQRVRDVVLTQAFPRNTLGKVMKFQLVESYAEATPAIVQRSKEGL